MYRYNSVLDDGLRKVSSQGLLQQNQLNSLCYDVLGRSDFVDFFKARFQAGGATHS